MSTTYEYIWIGGLPFIQVGEGESVELIFSGFGEKAKDIAKYSVDPGVKRFICAYYDLVPLRQLEVDFSSMKNYFKGKNVTRVIGNSLGSGLAHQVSIQVESELILLCPTLLQKSFWVKSIIYARRPGQLILKSGWAVAKLLHACGWKMAGVLHKSIDLFGTSGVWTAWSFYNAFGALKESNSKTSVFLCPNDVLIDERQVSKGARKLGWKVHKMECLHHRALAHYLSK